MKKQKSADKSAETQVDYRTPNAKAVMLLNAIIQYNNNPKHYNQIVEDLLENSNVEEKKEILDSIYAVYIYEGGDDQSFFYNYGLYNLTVIKGNFNIVKKILEHAVETGQIQQMINSYNKSAFIQAKTLSDALEYKLIVSEISKYIIPDVVPEDNENSSFEIDSNQDESSVSSTSGAEDAPLKNSNLENSNVTVSGGGTNYLSEGESDLIVI